MEQFVWPNLGHALFCLKATKGLGLWVLLKGICVSKWLQKEAQASSCTSQPGLCPATCTLTMTFKGCFPV